MFFNRFLFASRTKNDVKFLYEENNCIKPIALNMRLIFPVRNEILKKRLHSRNLTITRDQKKLSLIIPYRNREENLKIFLPTIKQYLQNQNIDYELIVVEQADLKPFNKAKLLNIAVLNSRKDSDYFVFHDVDVLPCNIDYRYCNHSLKPFSVVTDASNKRNTWLDNSFQKVVLVPKKIFFDINGWSNDYWQYGREDDDLFFRHIIKGHIPLFDEKGEFIEMHHEKSEFLDNTGAKTDDEAVLINNQKLKQHNHNTFWKVRRKLLSQDKDGLSTLKDYQVIDIKKESELSWIKVVFN